MQESASPAPPVGRTEVDALSASTISDCGWSAASAHVSADLLGAVVRLAVVLC
jgi:hypothetical protein